MADISKAFDSVDRAFLLKALTIEVGCPVLVGIVYDLIATNFKLEVSGHKSKLITTSNGIIQGSSISPVLFTYALAQAVELLPDYITAVLYADDSAFIFKKKHLILMNLWTS